MPREISWAKKVKAEPYIETGDGEQTKHSGWTPKQQPNIQQIPLEIKATFESKSNDASGVIVCHGGNQHGYSIYLDQASYTLQFVKTAD